jgi:hypothetical protein
MDAIAPDSQPLARFRSPCSCLPRSRSSHGRSFPDLFFHPVCVMGDSESSSSSLCRHGLDRSVAPAGCCAGSIIIDRRGAGMDSASLMQLAMCVCLSITLLERSIVADKHKICMMRHGSAGPGTHERRSFRSGFDRRWVFTISARKSRPKRISSKEALNEGPKFSAPSSYGPLQQSPIRGPKTRLPCAALVQSRLPCVALAPDVIAPVADAAISRDHLPPAPPSVGTICRQHRHPPGPSSAGAAIIRDHLSTAPLPRSISGDGRADGQVLDRFTQAKPV